MRSIRSTRPGVDGMTWETYEEEILPLISGKAVRKIVPPHPSHPIMGWPGANLEEKHEPRGVSVAEAQDGDSMKSSGRHT